MPRRHDPIPPHEFIASIHRDRLELRIVHHMDGKWRRYSGLYETFADADRRDRLTIATDLHRRADKRGHDLTQTMIHEMAHHLRPDAKETWIRYETRHLYADERVRAAAAIRLLDAAFYEDLP